MIYLSEENVFKFSSDSQTCLPGSSQQMYVGLASE